MKNPLAGCVGKPGDVHPLTASPLLEVGGLGNSGARHAAPAPLREARQPRQKAARGWKSYCI